MSQLMGLGTAGLGAAGQAGGFSSLFGKDGGRMGRADGGPPPPPDPDQQQKSSGGSGLNLGSLASLAMLFARDGGRPQHRAMGGGVAPSAPMQQNMNPMQASMALDMSPQGLLAQRLGRTPWGTPGGVGPSGLAGAQPTGLASGGSAPLTGPTGITTPQVDMSIYAMPTLHPGTMDNWFNPLPQYQNTSPPTSTPMNPQVLQALDMFPVNFGGTQGPSNTYNFGFHSGGRPHLADGGPPDDALPQVTPQPNPLRPSLAQAGDRTLSQAETPPSWQSQATNFGEPVWKAPRPDPWRAVTNAGLAMASGRSPNALENIAGGLRSGAADYEHELDTPPSVDHSGATIMVRYPDEEGDQQTLDTGIPTEAALNARAMGAYRQDMVGERGQAAEWQHEDRQQRDQDQARYQEQMAADRLLMAQIAQGREQQGKYQMIAGQGVDPATGKQVPGAYSFNEKTGQPEFLAGVVPTARTQPKDGGLSTTPAFTQAAKDYQNTFFDPISGAAKDPNTPPPDRATWTATRAQAYQQRMAPQGGQQATPAPRQAPEHGAIVNGYRYNGGNPNAQASWTKVQ